MASAIRRHPGCEGEPSGTCLKKHSSRNPEEHTGTSWNRLPAVSSCLPAGTADLIRPRHFTSPRTTQRGAQEVPCFCVIALIGAAMQHAWVFDWRDRGLPRRWAGYLLPKARAVTTCMQPNLVRHEICIALKLTFYYVTDYEYYITGPLTLSVKIEALLLGGGGGAGKGGEGRGGEGRQKMEGAEKERIIQERQSW